jgi:hypothetical protein
VTTATTAKEESTWRSKARWGEDEGSALSPFVNLGMQHNRRSAEPWMKKITTFCVVVGRQKGFAREHQHGFYET